MLRSAHDMRGYTIQASDGEIGKVYSFLFDDEKWTIRYLVVKTGNWLRGRLVLISPISMGEPDWGAQTLPVHLTQEQIKNSPDIDAEQPVSRQQEIEYFRYYNYPVYWGGPGLWGAGMYPTYPGYPGQIIPPPDTPQTIAQERTSPQGEAPEDEQGDPHLRSTHEVTGYHIHARDGSIGHVEDFIAEDANWAIRYMVIDTRNWWPGKKVLVAPRWIESVNWADRSVDVNLERETIKQGPEYDPSSMLNREYEAALYQHYGQPPYWQEEPERR